MVDQLQTRGSKMDNAVMEQLADQLCDVMWGKPKLSFAANEAIATALGLEMDEREMYEWQGEDYTQDQLVQYLAPEVLDRLSVQEALSYAFEMHKEKIDLPLPTDGQLPVLQEQPWLFPELPYRCVNQAGEAYYVNQEPICLHDGKGWAITGYTLNYRGHKLKAKYESQGCAVSLQHLEDERTMKVRNLADSSLAELKKEA